jgi:PAS domain S-box-containing protein
MDRPSIANRLTILFNLGFYLLIMTLAYYFLFNPILSLNPPFWTINAVNSLPQSTIVSFIIKDCINVVFLVLAASALLSITYVRRFMALPVSSTMRLNFQILSLSMLTAILVWGIFVVLDFALIKESHNEAKSYYPLALLVLLESGVIVSLILMRFSEKRLITEQLLVESKMRLKKAQEIGHVGSWEYDVQSGILIWSDEVYRIFGYKPFEVEPSFDLFLKLVHPDERAVVDKEYKYSIKSGNGIFEMEHRVIRNDTGEIRYVYEKGEHIINENGEMVKSAGMVQDITERHNQDEAIKEKNEELLAQNEEYLVLNEEMGDTLERLNEVNTELEEAREKSDESDRLKSAFLANLSHEIRTPMNAIIGFTELLSMPELSSDKQNEYIQIVKGSGRYLLAMIDDIMEISKIDTGQVKPFFMPVDLHKFINQIYSSTTVLIPKDKNIELRLVESEWTNGFCFLTDEVKLNQVVMNFITNAIKYTETGFIEIGCHKSDESNLTFYVRDSGVGINQKDKHAIFQRFWRAGSDQNIRIGGAGLGLAISKAYVELLGGNINMESEVGKGSKFSFTIPVKEAKLETETPIIPAQEFNQQSRQGVILVAEDDDINFLYFEALFENTNYELIRACNGQEAVDMCKSNAAIIFVLMDIKMPVLNGEEATLQIKEFRPTLPIVAQTAHVLTNKSRYTQFDGYITKPISRKELFKTIDKLLWIKK